MGFKYIVKVQKPVVSTDATNPWLIYNKRRIIDLVVAAAGIPDRIKEAMKGKYKMFWYIQCNLDTNEITWEEEAPWQNW